MRVASMQKYGVLLCMSDNSKRLIDGLRRARVRNHCRYRYGAWRRLMVWRETKCPAVKRHVRMKMAAMRYDRDEQPAEEMEW